MRRNKGQKEVRMRWRCRGNQSAILSIVKEEGQDDQHFLTDSYDEEINI